MTTKQKRTIYDIALKAGASPSTVSCALNGSWKKRRLRPETVERIKRIAREEGYFVNLQARGLRKARSGLAGMILPEHENRFFSELSQAFALETRERGLCPAIALTGRVPEEQARSVESLISYAVDLLVIAGASNPNELARMCRDAGVAHVFVDHPCGEAPSVVSDNFGGAQQLVRRMLGKMPPIEPGVPTSYIYFVGGDPALPATAQRLAGFRQEAMARGALIDSEQIRACGYEADRAEEEVRSLHARLGALPRGLFVNSIPCFEGVTRFLARIPEEEIKACTIGCFDYDPFGKILRFPVSMVRQRADLLMAEAYRCFDQKSQAPLVVKIAPELIG